MNLPYRQIQAEPPLQLPFREELHETTAPLEQQLCEYVGADYGVCVSSATAGMLMALQVCGVEPGDTVLCTSFSYFSTSQIIELAGATPLFVDINPNTFNIDPYCLEYAINKCERTHKPTPKALIAVDLFGAPCNYEALEEICFRNGIVLIEDMAHSFGGAFQGRRTGSFGRMAVASFFPSQPLRDLGEGGAVFCHDPKDYRRLVNLRGQSNGSDAGKFQPGYLDGIQASLVSEKLAALDKELELRRKIDGWYRKRLQGKVRMQRCGDEFLSACTQFVVAMKTPEERDALAKRLREQQIPSHTFEPSPTGYGGPLSDLERITLLNARSAAERILVLPIDPYLSQRVVHFICDCILEEPAAQ